MKSVRSSLGAPTGRDSRSLIHWIRAVMWGAIVVPTISFVLIAAWGYQRAVDEAQSKVQHASALSLRQAERLFEIAREVAGLADEATQAPDAEIQANERQVHQRLADLCAGLGFVIVNMNVWAADGSVLVRSDTFPVDRSEPNNDRRYFVDQREGTNDDAISELITGRQSGRELFNLTRRRHTPDGHFNGIIAVSLSPDSFRDYYRSLAADEPDLVSFALIRDDGTILARYPVLSPVHTNVDPDNPIYLRIHAGVSNGMEVVPERDGRERRLISFRRVAGWPAYVTAGVSNSSVIAGWLRFTALSLAVFVPVTAGLVWISWVAFRKTREERSFAEAMQRESQRRAQAEKAALEGQKLQTLAQLTGGVAHDFNNLLTIVSNNLHIFGRRHPELTDEKHLASVLRAVRSGVRLTRQLLSFSRMQALRPELVDLRVWLRETEELIRSTLGRRTSLDYDIAADTHPISVDVAELELALINAALNAQHAMAGGGLLHITAKNSDRTIDGRELVVVCVEDNGCGIPPELQARVFEPFFTTKEAGKGSGLGLSQVAGLCEQAGGFADIQSIVGSGTTVRMHFPAMTNLPHENQSRPDAHVETVTGTILLVEDNSDVALVTEQVLRAAGFDVACVFDATAALALMEENSQAIDVVFSDITMPGEMDGVQLALVIRQRWPSTPVILTTGYAERIHEATSSGIRVLNKPVEPETLLEELRAAVRSRASNDEQPTERTRNVAPAG